MSARGWSRLTLLLVVLPACTAQGPTATPTTPPHPTASSSPQAPPTSAVPSPTGTSGTPRVRLAARLPGPVIALAAGRHSVYAEYEPPHSGNRVLVRIARFDPSTGVVARSRPIVRGGDMALAGGSLWVGGSVPVAGGTRGLLFGLDPRTLSVDRVIALPTVAGPLAVGPSGLWTGGVRHLYRIDPDTGAVLASIRIRGAVSRLAIDPSGRLLYVARNVPGFGDGLPPEERDAVSGALEATSPFNPGYAANWLAATDHGVWLSTATGNFGAAFFLRQKGLKARPRAIESNQGVVASLARGWLWVPMNLGRELICADPVTGRRAGTFTLGQRAADGYEVASNVVTVGHSTFVGTGAGIVRIPASRCTP